MGHWLDNDRQAERGAAHEAKKGTNQTPFLKWKKIRRERERKKKKKLLTKSAAGLALATQGWGVAALTLSHGPPTRANV